MNLLSFFATSKPIPRRTDLTPQQEQRLYRKLGLQSFVAATLGYSLYYVCRTSLNVMKKPILDSGLLDATELGMVGSALLFAYAIGKFVNGFLADHSNIKRFMAAGLATSALASIIMGAAGLAGSAGLIGSGVLFLIFAIAWSINGWAQSMGSPPAVISLSRWFPLSRRGTFYGFFSASHNIGEWLSFIFVGYLVATAGWQWGFFGAAIAGILGVLLILWWMHDTPESKGLAPIEEMSHEKKNVADSSAKEAQRVALRTPAVYILALASAFMYISRYSLNSWGVLFLQEQKGFALTDATFVISINALLGIVGTVFSGWMSDVVFKGDRKLPALFAGVLLSVSYAMFIYCGNSYWVNIASMVLFGIAIGVLISFVGGLMAVDIVPRKATGAALGIVGMASYAAAGIQDVVSGYLIDSNTTEVVNAAGEVVKHYDFSQAAIFWIGASVISFLLPLLNWRHKVKED